MVDGCLDPRMVSVPRVVEVAAVDLLRIGLGEELVEEVDEPVARLLVLTVLVGVLELDLAGCMWEVG